MTTKPKPKKRAGRVTIKLINKKAFDRMKPARQRVALAKDVVMRLRMNRIIPMQGVFVKLEDQDLNDDLRGDEDAKKIVTENVCEVCAKGSIILAWAANFNKLRIDEVLNTGGYLEELSGIFPDEMWDQMETEFEENDMPLRDIMKNLIANDGNFKIGGMIYTDP